MRKIFTIMLLFIITFTSSFATTGLKTTLNSDDLLSAEIFYIGGEGYTKENGKLKKVENVKFYSIAGTRYIKKDSKIEKINETKLYKINNTSYVKDNNKLVTLEKFLTYNKVKDKAESGTFSDIHKETLEKAEPSKDDETADNILKYIFEDETETKDESVTIESDTDMMDSEEPIVD